MSLSLIHISIELVALSCSFRVQLFGASPKPLFAPPTFHEEPKNRPHEGQSLSLIHIFDGYAQNLLNMLKELDAETPGVDWSLAVTAVENLNASMSLSLIHISTWKT